MAWWHLDQQTIPVSESITIMHPYNSGYSVIVHTIKFYFIFHSLKLSLKVGVWSNFCFCQDDANLFSNKSFKMLKIITDWTFYL